MTKAAKAITRTACPNTGKPFEASTEFIHAHTSYRKCSYCGKNVAGDYSKPSKVRWHKEG